MLINFSCDLTEDEWVQDKPHGWFFDVRLLL